MSIRFQRYVISPATACPAALLNGAGLPGNTMGLDMEEVGHAAWRELLQTAPGGSPFFSLFEELLEPGTDLIWKEKGPGRGAEMRRSMSGLFGRFFARAYLEQYHDFAWFSAIDGDGFQLSKRWRVKKLRSSQSEMPDWICAKPGELAIAEAKGSHQKGNATRGGRPGPIKTAEGQIDGVQVQRRRVVGGIRRWVPKTVKGWAVMSRWGTTSPSRNPYMYVLDPDTQGEEMSAPERDELIQEVARSHVAQLAEGLGLIEKGKLRPRRTVRIVNDTQKRRFVGAVMSPFGPLDISVDQAINVSKQLPPTSPVQFLGIEERVLQAYFNGDRMEVGERGRIGDWTLTGQDGSILAPVDQVLAEPNSPPDGTAVLT